MIRLVRRGVVRGEIWFDEPVVPPCADILIVHHGRVPPDTGSFTVKHSLVTDLTLTEEDLWNAIKRSCRREIRRGAEAALSVSKAHMVRHDDEIVEFAAFYNRFAEERGLASVDVDRLRAIVQARRLWLSSVSNASETVARNCYIATRSTMRCLYGASIIRSVPLERKKAVGHAHRLLDWTDIIAFKQAGFTLYDWGGLFPDETNPVAKRINDFKRQFGGAPVEYYEFVKPASFLGHVYLRLRPAARAASSIWQRLRLKATAGSVTGSATALTDLNAAGPWII